MLLCTNFPKRKLFIENKIGNCLALSQTKNKIVLKLFCIGLVVCVCGKQLDR